jgi:hypothetical protein
MFPFHHLIRDCPNKVLIRRLVLFNSLCVLIGAMAMKPEDMAVVVPDLQKANMMIQTGLRNIHELGERGGESIWHSERFLRRLIRNTRRKIEVCCWLVLHQPSHF